MTFEYPTWVRTGKGWRSEEQFASVPDFTIEYVGPEAWQLKWRTSSQGKTFTSAALAKRSVEIDLINPLAHYRARGHKVMSKKTDTPCEAGLVSQCRAPKTTECRCCGLWLCHAHQDHEILEAR
jgi:hypothetical protein